MVNYDNLAIMAALIFGFAFPLGIALWWKKKTGAKLWPFITGAICFTAFAMILEQIPHTFCLMLDNPISNAIKNNPIIYMIYGALAAGIFEETGRLFGFKVLLKKYYDKKSAIAYGIGHGGIEVALIVGITYLLYFLALCGVDFGTAEVTQSLRDAAGTIQASTVCMIMLERISAMIVHIGLSMIVFVAAKKRGKMWLYPVAIILHAIIDAPGALFQTGVAIPLWAIEVVAFVLAIVYFIVGKKIIDGYSKAD